MARVWWVLLALGLFAQPAAAQTVDLVSQTAFRVCADPANLPFSNDKGEGFENKIAEHLAAKLGLPVQYEWFPMATGFVRRTLLAGKCDVIIGYSTGDDLVLNTNTYYTSTHVLVTKADSPLVGVSRFEDPKLQGRHLGIVAGSPPASHLARVGLIGTARPYNLFADRRFEDPSGKMIADLLAGTIDAAVLWGPIGGYLVKQNPGLAATPIGAENASPKLHFRISMGVRQDEVAWKRKLNSLLRREAEGIHAILRDYGVPIVGENGEPLAQ